MLCSTRKPSASPFAQFWRLTHIHVLQLSKLNRRKIDGSVSSHLICFPLGYLTDILATAHRLTAIWNIKNGRVLERVEGRHWACEVIQEVAMLASTMVAQGLSHAAPTRDEMILFVSDTAAATAENWSSMHQDIAKGRMTEVEELNGWIVSKAKALGVPCEHNEWLTERVREITVL